MSRTFATEAEAKAFAREIMMTASDVAAGTLNPHQPKRIISTARVADWIAGFI